MLIIYFGVGILLFIALNVGFGMDDSPDLEAGAVIGLLVSVLWPAVILGGSVVVLAYALQWVGKKIKNNRTGNFEAEKSEAGSGR